MLTCGKKTREGRVERRRGVTLKFLRKGCLQIGKTLVMVSLKLLRQNKLWQRQNATSIFFSFFLGLKPRLFLRPLCVQVRSCYQFLTMKYTQPAPTTRHSQSITHVNLYTTSFSCRLVTEDQVEKSMTLEVGGRSG